MEKIKIKIYDFFIILFSSMLVATSILSLATYIAYSNEIQQTINYCELEKTNYEFDGKSIEPSAIIINGYGKRLKSGIDYKLEYEDKITDIGQYNIQIIFKGKYKNLPSESKLITVRPQRTHINSLSSEANRITVNYETSENVDGYEIDYSTHERFDPNITASVSIINPDTDTETINHLRFNSTYYFRIRTYKTVGKKNIYSYWSDSSSSDTQETKWKNTEKIDGFQRLIKNSDNKSYTTIIENKVRVDEDGNYQLNIAGGNDESEWVYVDYYICYYEMISQRFKEFSVSYNSTGALYIDNDSHDKINEYYGLVFNAYKEIGILQEDSDFEKYEKICKWINENITYAYDNYENHHFYAENGLKDGETVCGGYAALIKDFCFIANIPCEVIQSENHAWVIVKIDEKWYPDELGYSYINYQKFIDEEDSHYDLKTDIFFSPYNSSNYSETNEISTDYQFILDYKI